MQFRFCAVLPRAHPPNQWVMPNAPALVRPLHAQASPISGELLAYHYPVRVSVLPHITTRDLAAALDQAYAPTPRMPANCSPLTLIVTEHTGTQWIPDPLAPLATAGIPEGACIEARRFAPARPPASRGITDVLPAPQACPAVAELEVLSGPETGAVFPLISGENTVGRDPSNRVMLHDARMSRVHATLTCEGDALRAVDHYSSNGTFLVEKGVSHRISTVPISFQLPVSFSFGGVRAQVRTCVPAPAHEVWRTPPISVYPRSVVTTESRCGPTQIRVPDLPAKSAAHRFPVLSAVAPATAGLMFFFVTHSVASLASIAIAPLIIAASWSEQWWNLRRAQRRTTLEYQGVLKQLTADITAAQLRERFALERQLPSARARLEQYRGAPPLPVPATEPPAFFLPRLRCGRGATPSNVEVLLPNPTTPQHALWSAVQQLRERAATIADAPVALDVTAGPVLVVGTRPATDEVLRALLLQALVQAAPTTLTLCVFACSAESVAAWSWAAWLPHTVYSTTQNVQTMVAHTLADRERLLRLLESVARVRGQLAEPVAGVTFLVLLLGGPGVDADRICALGAMPERLGIVVLLHGAHQATAAASSDSGAAVVLDLTADIVRAPAKLVGEHSTNRVANIRMTGWEECSEATATAVASRLGYAAATQAETPPSASSSTPNVVSAAAHANEIALPDVAALCDLAPYTNLRSAAHQEQHWAHSSSLIATIGVGVAGPVRIDLRDHGPHALVAGTTGSGKSEFLQSWILALASNHPPHRLTFFLLDYKGGSAFSECARLPHLVGYVTDLTAAFAQRAHVSLVAEIKFRERLFAELGVPDIEAAERDHPQEAPPNLVIVVDECAVLLREYPPFGEILHDLAQRGRSLGIHLILATQRPAGVITDQLRANISIRVALRVADITDSQDLLHCAVAADIDQETPGRAYVRMGVGGLFAIQTAYVGEQAAEVCHCQGASGIHIQQFAFGPAPLPMLTTMSGAEHRPDCRAQKAARGRSVVTTGSSRIIARLCAVAQFAPHRSPRQLWQAPLPAVLRRADLDSLLDRNISHRSGAHTLVSAHDFNLCIGVQDLPHQQRQQPYHVALAPHGNVLVWGTARSGKTTTLLTLTAELLRLAPTSWVYLFFSAESSAATQKIVVSLGSRPNCGGVISLTDGERITRACSLFVSFVRARASQENQPQIPVVIVIDHLGTFRETLLNERTGAQTLREFTDVLKHGAACGVHVFAACARNPDVPSEWSGYFPVQLCHRITEMSDLTSLGFTYSSAPTAVAVSATSVSTLVAGRAVLRGEAGEIHIMLPELPDTPPVTPGAARPAPAVLPLPTAIHRGEWETTNPGAGYCALNLETFVPYSVPRAGLCIVTGPANSGRSTALLALTEAATDRAVHERLRCCSILLRGADSALPEAFAWSHITASSAHAFVLLQQLAPHETAVLVIEHTADTTEASVQRLCTAHTAHTLVFCELPHQLPHDEWEVLSFFRRAEWVLALQPDTADTPCVLTTPLPPTSRARCPVGRGVIVNPGAFTRVQIALPRQHFITTT